MTAPAMLPRPARWSLPVRVLHWVMAALVLGLLALGFVMTSAPLDLPTSFTLYQWHKWLGLLILALWLPRVVSRLSSVRPAEVAGWEGRVARLTHGALYAALLAMPLAGWLATSASPLRLPLAVPVPGLGLVPVPQPLTPDPDVYAVLSGIHMSLAYVLTGLVTLHIAAALKHALVDRDGTLRRMCG